MESSVYKLFADGQLAAGNGSYIHCIICVYVVIYLIFPFLCLGATELIPKKSLRDILEEVAGGAPVGECVPSVRLGGDEPDSIVVTTSAYKTGFEFASVNQSESLVNFTSHSSR
jgi:hypothetical protein